MSWFRRVACAAALALLGVTASASAASAHALLRSSEPADGATLDASPQAVTISFTERPDLAASSISVLDASGRAVGGGRVHTVPGEPLVLRLPITRPLPEGVYTATWRVLSRVDGHVTAGAFAFGVGVSPADAPRLTMQQTSPGPTALSVGGRALFYAGVMLLVGAAWVAAIAFARPPGGTVALTAAGATAAAVGLLAVVESQRRAAGIAMGDLLATSVGRALTWRGVPLLAAIVAVAVARRRGGRNALLAAGGAGALAMLAHTMLGHPAAGADPAQKVAAQTIHFLAAGVWIGGLAALLVGIRTGEPAVRARAARRFSSVALATVVVLAATGTARAVDEVGAWSLLTSTTFGRLVLLKIVLLAALVVLGAINRFRTVPVAGERPGPLRTIARVELVLAAAVLVMTGALSGIAPAKEAAAQEAAARAAGPIVVQGADFGTTLRVRLTVEPGLPGANRFTLSVRDYDTGRPVDATRAALLFTFRGLSDVGESTLDLDEQSPGLYVGRGGNLAIDGPWRVTALVQTPTNASEIALEVRTKSKPQQVQVSEVPGAPTLYTVQLGASRSVQFYADPGTPGYNEVHATFFEGTEEIGGLEDVVMLGTPVNGEPRRLAVEVLTPGHFVASGELPRGRWRFDVAATAPDGTPLTAYFEESIDP